MAFSNPAGLGRVRQFLSWSAIKDAWVEAAAGLALLLGVGAAWWFDDRLVLAQRIFVWSLLLVTLAVLSRRGWLKLFGPVLFYDMVRVARRSRYISFRCIYVAALLIVLYWQYTEVVTVRPMAQFTRMGRSMVPTMGALPPRANLMAEFAERFFNVFMVLQFSLVMLLTPVYAASSIAEEKDRKTLEYLLATDLRNREIVLGKLLSRLAILTLTVLTGLPVLSVVQFLGGVDPDLLLAGFAATFATMASLTALSVLFSVYARKPRDAILFTYLGLAAYTGLGYLADQVSSTPGWATTHLSFFGVPITIGSIPMTLGEVVNGFNAGNLPIVLYNLRANWAAGNSLANLIAGLLQGYLLFHLAVTVVCATWAVLRVRSVALRQTTSKRRSKAVRLRPRIRPRLAIKPMVWKEVFVEPGFRLTWIGWIAVGVFVLISLAPAIWIGVSYLNSGLPGARRASVLIQQSIDELNSWMRITGAVVGCLLLLAVAARASTSISGERDRETLDALLASPLQSHDIIFAKWLGSLLSVRWGWLWLWLIWIVAMAPGAMNPLAVPLFIIAWLVYASCFAGIGLWFSIACRTSLRATLWTLSTVAVAAGGHLLLWMCCSPMTLLFGGWIGPLRALGTDLLGLQAAVTPAAVLFWVSNAGYRAEDDVIIIIAYFTLFLWALAALFLWTITRSRFRRITARMPYRRPELQAYPGAPGWGYGREPETWEESGASVAVDRAEKST
jgi:ABC-type Na+ efflux pump permease subunit